MCSSGCRTACQGLPWGVAAPTFHVSLFSSVYIFVPKNFVVGRAGMLHAGALHSPFIAISAAAAAGMHIADLNNERGSMHCRPATACANTNHLRPSRFACENGMRRRVFILRELVCRRTHRPVGLFLS